MYILYMDESGTEEVGAGTSHFVLLGLMVPAESWKSVDAVLENIKARYGLGEIEIHAGWMSRRYSEQESIRGFEELDRPSRRAAAEAAVRKRAGVIAIQGSKKKIKSYRRESRAITPYLDLARAERQQCLADLAQELASWSDVRIFADAVSKSDFASRTRTPYEMAFEQVLSRYQAFLTGKQGARIVVHDNNSTVAPRLMKLSRKFHQVGTFYRQITNIVETPLFVDSSLTSMVQMADLCAYALRRFVESGEERLWSIVEARVDRRGNTAVGVRHYTGKRDCRCRVCIAHGRYPAENPQGVQ